MKYRDIELLNLAQKKEMIEKLKKNLVTYKIKDPNNYDALPANSVKQIRKDIARLYTSLNS